MSDPLRPSDPRAIGRYRLLRRLGQGGMGTVYLAESPEGRRVAVKVIRPEYAHEEHYRARFRSEVSRARQVPPFCTAEVLDADPDHETPYLVVEYVDGPSLGEVVAGSGPLTGGSLHGVAVGVATALAAIHGAGVIHRDLKPRNVLFALGTPKVIDFGIARPLEPTSFHTRAEEVVGTLAYMAPERLDPETDRLLTPAADVFAWGAVVTYAGTGRTPFGGDSPGVTAARILTQPPRIGDLPPYLAELVVAALEKDPARRPTAPELLDRLLVPGAPAAPPLPAELRREAVAAQRSSHGGGRRHGSSGRTKAVVLTTAMAVAVAGAGAGMVLRGRDEARSAAEASRSAAAQAPAVVGPAVFDSLRRPDGLFSGTAACTYRDGLRVTAKAGDYAMCGSYLHTVFPAAQSAQVSATLGNDRSCAAIWFRATDQDEEDYFADAYRLAVCPDEVSLVSINGGAASPLASAPRATPVGSPHRIVLVADERQANVTVDGAPVLQGPLTATNLISGRVLFGTVAEKGGRGEVTFTDVQLRSGTNLESPSVPAFLDGDAQFTAGVHMISDRDRVAVVEPASLLTGAEYCRRFDLNATTVRCEDESVPVMSGTQVTLPVAGDPVYRDFRPGRAECRDPRTAAGTCAVPFAEFAVMSGEPSPFPALVTVRGGEVVEVAKIKP
ncbi:serine/threonine-protein kinase [Actinoplanes sp. NPDC023714]|uniref:serine/threonine protein kinase n=1 Tax=Actinoplanes sp. NPDC023714 TaxID=3154322 RepID=UPI003400C5FC